MTEHDNFKDAANEHEVGILREFWEFLCHNKKWWLTPLIAMLLLFGALIALGGTVAAPFIYTLF
jgi:hypothetical protein